MVAPITPADLPVPRGLGPGAPMRTRLITAASVLFASRPLHEVTLDLIAEEAGVDPDTVRAIFPSEGSALAAVLAFVTEGLRDAGQDEAPARGWTALGNLMQSMIQGTATPGFIRLYHDAQLAAAEPSHPAHDWLLDQQSAMRATLDAAVRTGIDDGEMLADTDPESIHRLIAATVAGLYPVSLIFCDRRPLESSLEDLLDCLKARYATPEFLARG